MIKVQIYRDRNNNIIRYSINGHSGYDRIGKDIVCSAVSSVTQAAALGILQVLNIDAKVEMKEAYLDCRLPDNLSQTSREKANAILETMVLFLNELQKQYREYVQIIEQEV